MTLNIRILIFPQIFLACDEKAWNSVKKVLLLHYDKTESFSRKMSLEDLPSGSL